jgi:hypothetical protein
MSADPVAELLDGPRFKGQPITWGVTSEGYDTIRRAWLTHVQAEEILFKPFTADEFEAQMAVMLSVFTDGCVMELATTGERWEGYERATEFYRVFLSSLQAIAGHGWQNRRDGLKPRKPIPKSWPSRCLVRSTLHG